MPFSNAQSSLFIVLRAFESGDPSTLTGFDYSTNSGNGAVGAYGWRDPGLDEAGVLKFTTRTRTSSGYKGDMNTPGDWQGQFGISLNDFLNGPNASTYQDNAALVYMNKLENRIPAAIAALIGTQVNGITITESGILLCYWEDPTQTNNAIKNGTLNSTLDFAARMKAGLTVQQQETATSGDDYRYLASNPAIKNDSKQGNNVNGSETIQYADSTQEDITTSTSGTQTTVQSNYVSPSGVTLASYTTVSTTSGSLISSMDASFDANGNPLTVENDNSDGTSSLKTYDYANDMVQTETAYYSSADETGTENSVVSDYSDGTSSVYNLSPAGSLPAGTVSDIGVYYSSSNGLGNATQSPFENSVMCGSAYEQASHCRVDHGF